MVGFDADLLRALLGDLYEIVPFAVHLEQVGFHFVARPRVYFVLALRGRVRLNNTEQVYEAVCEHLRGEPTDSWLEWIWQASSEELIVEENATRALRKRPLLTNEVAPSHDWTCLLTSCQRAELQLFMRNFEKNCGKVASPELGSIVDLGQKVDFQKAKWPNRRLPTIRRGSRRFWSAFRKRWFTPCELASCMGFAVYPDTAAAAGVEVDELTRSLVASSTSAVGNAMHVGNIGTMNDCYCCHSLRRPSGSPGPTDDRAPSK